MRDGTLLSGSNGYDKSNQWSKLLAKYDHQYISHDCPFFPRQELYVDPGEELDDEFEEDSFSSESTTLEASCQLATHFATHTYRKMRYS